MNIRTGFALAAAFALTACSSSSSKPTPQPQPTTMHFSGTVRRDTGSGQQPQTVSGVAVRASVDRNGDGAIGAGESVSVQSDADGAYALDIPVAAGDLVVVRFTRSGSGTVYRPVQGAPGGSMVASATLKDLESLDCSAAGCTAAKSGLTVKGLPAGASGSARAFNPVTETSAFPGDFNDSAGNLLQSGVFASFSLRDGSGSPLETLSAPATIKMKIPRDTWGVVRDITPGTGRIEYPLYAFDEVKGTWVREGNGYLENEAGSIVPESAGTTIRTGAYTGTLYAVGDVTHFSSWNCDWPVSSHGRIGGTVGECWWNGERKPCAGATVTARGESYTGTSTPVTVGAGGTFGIDVMRSEAPGEDLDGDGVTGKTSRVAVRVGWNGQVYDVGSRDMPSTATSGGSVTADLGSVVLDDSNRLQATLCNVTGTLRTADGLPATEGFVYAWDEELPDDIVTALCLQNNQFRCTPVASVDPDGSFSITVPAMGGVTLFSAASSSSPDQTITETSMATRTLASCPASPVQLTLDQGYVAVRPTITVTGSGISWTPAGYGASMVEVLSGSDLKWIVSSDAGIMSSPVTYGVVPAGATQSYPATGAPAALASGDQVVIILTGTRANGFTYGGSGTYTIP